MICDLSSWFAKYENIVAEVDTVFARVRQAYPDKVACAIGCSDCCYALFDLSLIEALYLNHHFQQSIVGEQRAEILEQADKIDREVYKLKRKIFSASQQGTPAQELLAQVARMRIRCPLLDQENRCLLYDQRPVTCRLYGVPMAIHGQAHTCGVSGFQAGQAYQTVNMDRLQERLLQLSQELAEGIHSTHTGLAEMLVPLSMALLTTYDAEYLGIPKEQLSECSGGGAWILGEGGRKLDSCEGCDKGTENCDPSSCGVTPGGDIP